MTFDIVDRTVFWHPSLVYTSENACDRLTTMSNFFQQEHLWLPIKLGAFHYTMLTSEVSDERDPQIRVPGLLYLIQVLSLL